MGDRVEENREEQRILEQRLMTQRAEAKRSEATRAFSTFVEAAQRTHRADAQKNDGRQQQQGSANQRLLARRGIDNNEFSGRMLGEGNERLLKTRDAEKRGAAAAAMRRDADGKVQEKAGHPLAAVSSRDSRDRRGNKDDGQHRGNNEARRELVMGSQTGQAIFATSGIAPKESSGAAGGAFSPQRMIDEIVKAVHKGVDAKGFGVMHIELKESAFGGNAATSLTVHAQHDGVTMAVHTDDDQVGRLLSAGSTAHELSLALQGKGIKLKTLEVNNLKVIG